MINEKNKSALEENSTLDTKIAYVLSMVEQATFDKKQLEDELMTVEAESKAVNDEVEAISEQAGNGFITDYITVIRSMFSNSEV